MALIQINVPDKIKEKADKVLLRHGVTISTAMTMMITQIANTGKTPFDAIFIGDASKILPDSIKRNILLTEAVESGIVPAGTSHTDLDDHVLSILGLTEDELT